MMKKLCILGILLCFLLTGCGNAMDTNMTKDAETTNNTRKVLAKEIEQLEEDKPDAALMEQYPEWFDEDGNIVYPYTPYQPKKWKKADKEKKIPEELNIPENLVDALSTKHLLQAVENYPLLTFNIYYDVEEAVYYRSRIFNGMEALLARQDCGKAAFESYCSRNIKPAKKYGNNKNYRKDSDLLSQLSLEEYLIAQETTYEALTEAERNLMIKVYRKNKRKKQKLKAYSDMWLYDFSFESVVSKNNNPWNALLNSKVD